VRYDTAPRGIKDTGIVLTYNKTNLIYEQMDNIEVNHMAKENYIKDLNSLLEKAVNRMRQEHSHFIIYTASIWTDKSGGASAINFDSKENSLKMIAQSNEYDKKYYDKYISSGDLEMAELFKPKERVRVYNPADFVLADFEKIEHSYVPPKWHSILVKFGEYAFEKILRELNVDKQCFEFGVNSTKDWYDTVWHIKDYN
jgi:hypothetical protein